MNCIKLNKTKYYFERCLFFGKGNYPVYNWVPFKRVITLRIRNPDSRTGGQRCASKASRSVARRVRKRRFFCPDDLDPFRHLAIKPAL